MNDRKVQRLGVGGMAGAALLLATASTAWACTTFASEIRVSGNGTGNVAQGIAAEDLGYSMTWCFPELIPDENASDADKSAFWTARVNGSSPSLTVTIQDPGRAWQTCSDGIFNEFTDATNYKVKLQNDYMQNGAGGTAHNCHDSSSGTLLTSSFAVSSNSGTQTFTPSSMSVGWSNVCVYHSSLQWAAAANFKVL